MKISIVTVCVGDFPMGEDYVLNLLHGFSRFLDHEFDFYCITDREFETEAVITVPPVRNAWGWWNLMEIFRPDAAWSHDGVIMVGLDTVIRGDISWIAGHPCPVFLKPFSDQYGYDSPYRGMVADGLVWLPPSDHMTFLWDEYVEHIDPSVTHKEMRLFPMHVWNTHRMDEHNQRPLFWQDILPGMICSYRMPERKVNEPDEPLVIFHGEPRPHEAITDAPWIERYWTKWLGK